MATNDSFKAALILVCKCADEISFSVTTLNYLSLICANHVQLKEAYV